MWSTSRMPQRSCSRTRSRCQLSHLVMHHLQIRLSRRQLLSQLLKSLLRRQLSPLFLQPLRRPLSLQTWLRRQQLSSKSCLSGLAQTALVASQQLLTLRRQQQQCLSLQWVLRRRRSRQTAGTSRSLSSPQLRTWRCSVLWRRQLTWMCQVWLMMMCRTLQRSAWRAWRSLCRASAQSCRSRRSQWRCWRCTSPLSPQHPLSCLLQTLT
mmetsp:Transcript_28235/g.71987  ORF Transcript_28235/g.71987 Transcript_28235/m.71987 type:complete len:209 (+) Transcript_28235:253-879(+)